MQGVGLRRIAPQKMDQLATWARNQSNNSSRGQPHRMLGATPCVLL